MKWLNDLLKEQQLERGFTDRAFNYAHLTTIQEASVIASAIYNGHKQIFVIKENETQARALQNQIEGLFEDIKVVLFSQEDSLRVEAIASSPEAHYEKMESLYRILYEEVDVIITTVASVMRYIADPDYVKEQNKLIKVGDEISMNEMVEHLIGLGYTQVQVVEKPFTFAKRGGIIDVYSVQYQQPVRIDYFDDLIDSLRFFDVETQRSLKETDEILVFVASEYLGDQEQKVKIVNKVESRLKKIETRLSSDEFDILYENVRKDVDAFIINQVDARFYAYFALGDGTHRLYDYCPHATIMVSSQQQVEKAGSFFVDESVNYLLEQYEGFKGLDYYDIFGQFDDVYKRKPILVQQFQAKNEVEVDIHELFNPQLEISDLIDLIKRQAQEHRVVLSVATAQMEALINQLIERKCSYTLLIDDLEDNGVYIQNVPLQSGFSLTNQHIMVYSSRELFNQVVRRGKFERQFQVAQSLSGIADLKRGDYVVHRNYGIGKYLGLETKEINHHPKDFIHIAYRNDDALLVPLEQFKLIRKFTSSEGLAIKLSKLGTNEWNKTKNKIKDAVNDVADRLIALYKARQQQQGFAFSKDNEFSEEFEAEFPYELTRDQIIAINEVKRDMESSHPMDRLLCGDVGFGKTEVAIRAAMKAVIDHKQVVFLCPTTVLSQQHYRTFTQRFKNFPVDIGLLNRFVEPSQQKQTIAKVRKGQIDILIGTHRALSKDVRFKDLGLLIIDEEQRFGVEQKERIKEIKTNVDVLSLSATPIPRTLQMSLVGIRSLSQLNTPPSNRLPVVTHIVEKNQKLIEDLIEREIARQGQVFYLYNNVEQIYNVAYRLQSRFPDITIAVAHGKMARDEIEDVMMAFTRNDIQVLVCTTIVETGIDIPNANTMIIDKADRFGLAQLYQIKGRVGRSDRLAYAYLMIDPMKQLSEIATKRLEAIKEFTQLGSGYKIAMRDLTIRGAGEILGGNQSGFIDTVGIDLYIELLQEALAEKQGETVAIKETRPLNIDVDSYIPDEYTADESLKIELYQKIDKITTMDALKKFYQESEDRYGDFPNSVKLLLEKKQLELLLSDPRIEDFKERQNTAIVIFTKEYSDKVDGVKFFEAINKVSKDIRLKYLKQQIRLEIDKSRGWLSELLTALMEVQQEHAH